MICATDIVDQLGSLGATDNERTGMVAAPIAMDHWKFVEVDFDV